MSTEDTFDTATEDIFNLLGVDGIFTPNIGDTVECKVHLVTGIVNEPYTDSKVWGTDKTVEAILDVIGKEPDKDETFTIGGVVYTVCTVIANDGRFVTVTVK